MRLAYVLRFGCIPSLLMVRSRTRAVCHPVSFSQFFVVVMELDPPPPSDDECDVVDDDDDDEGREQACTAAL